jgi:hypothetical protein
LPWLALLALLLAAPAAFAAWDFTPAGDPNRNWGAAVTATAGYDDNFNAQSSHQESGFRIGTDIKLRAAVAIDRLFLAGTYDYQVNSSTTAVFDAVDQTHNLNVTANYVASPRLTFALTENYINTLQPGIVLNQSGTPISLVDAGQYSYDYVSGVMNYALTERWSISCAGNWDIWQYDLQAYATNNDHQDYGATVSALYALDKRTTVGLNYQWGENIYVNPGSNSALNADSHTVYLSVVRRFSPLLSATLNGGYTIRYAADGSTSSSPSGYGQLTYNYASASTLSLTLAESLSATSIQVTRQYSAEENSSVAIDLNHQVTVRLHALADLTYQYSSYTAPPPGSAGTKSSPNDQALTFHLGLNYAFRSWISAVLDYYYTRLDSGDPLVSQSYSRDQINVGTTLTY